MFEVAADVEQAVRDHERGTAVLLPEPIEFQQGIHAVSLGRAIRNQDSAVWRDDVGR